MREIFLKLLLCAYTVGLIIILSHSVSFGQDVKTPFATTTSPLANRYAYSNNGLWIDSAVKLVYYKQTSDSTLLGVDMNGKLYKVTKSMIGHWVSGGGGGGGLSSVALAMPSGFSVSGSPLTSNGTITVSALGNATTQYINGAGGASLVSNLPISTATQTALNAKQATLVSGSNIKTVNGNTLLGSGNVSVGDAYTSGTLAQFAQTSSVQLFNTISDPTGNGSVVFSVSPSLTTPNLGTPSAGNLVNCTFPVLNQNTTGSAGSVSAANITGTTLASGVTASSLTSFGSSPTLVAPRINVGSDATGDLYYRSAGSTLQRVGIGADGQVLTVVSGLPEWATGGGGGSVTSVSGTTPINVATGTTTPAITIDNAAADGSTKGAASFTAADFNASSGNVSIDYANGQAASSSQKGFLTSTDWNTFNGKQGAITLTTTGTSGAATLTGGTLNIPQYSGGGGGVTTVGSFNATSTANGLDISGSNIALHAADGTNPGALTATTQTIAGVKTFTSNSVFQPTVTTGTGSSAGIKITANSLTTGNGVEISSNSVTTGSVVNITGHGANCNALTIIPDDAAPNALVKFTRNTYNNGVTQTTSNSTTGQSGYMLQVYSLELGSTNSATAGVLLGNWRVGYASSLSSSANATLDVNGTGYFAGVISCSGLQTTSFAAGYAAKTANYTLGSSDHIINCTSNSFTITLPSAAGITGREYIIKNTGSSTTITIATTSSQTIDGAAPGTVISLTPLRVISDGANWITW